MASKKVEQKKKVLRFGFIIHDAVDYEINKKTPEIIDSISSASLVKALELVTRQHYGCNCYHCKLYKMIIEILLKRNDTYLIAPETLDYIKGKNRLFRFTITTVFNMGTT